MANIYLPEDERNLTPDEVALIEKRRSRGMMLMVVSGQFAIITMVLLLWVVQDVTYAPGWAHPILYYFLLAILISVSTGISGAYLRRGAPEF
jgi:hypothetical protein